MDENLRNFIIELEALSRKYKLQISGCGCCSSPSIDPLEEDELHPRAGYVVDAPGDSSAGDLTWVSGKWASEDISQVIR